MNRFLIGLALLALVLPGAAMAYTPLTDADGDEIEPNPYIAGNVTISNHKPACDDDVLCFYDDSNDAASLADYGLRLHTERVDEPIQFSPAKVDAQYYGEDVDAKSKVSAWGGNISNKAWLDTSNWVASNAAEGGEVFERTVRNGAHAIRILNPAPGASTDTDTYTLDFTDITSDVNKLRLVIGVEVVSNGDTFEIDIFDGNLSGIDSFSYLRTGTADGITHVLANGTGVTFWDELVSEGADTQGGVNGDIGKIALDIISSAANGATEVYVYALGLQTTRYSFGLNDLGENVYNMTYTDCEGVARSTPLGHVCLASFDPSFDYQNMKDLRVAYIVDAANLPADNVDLLPTEINDEAFPWKVNYEMTFELPKMIDLTYAGDESLKYVLPVIGSQHDTLTVGSVDKVKDVEKKKAGEIVTLASSGLASKKTEVEFTILFTEAQMHQTTERTVLGGIFSPDGIFGSIWIKLAGVAGLGLIFARGLGRKRKGA